MSDSDQKKLQPAEAPKEMGILSKGMSELLVSDVLLKHGITQDQRRKLTAEQKQEIMDLVKDLQRQVDQFVNKGNVEHSVPSQAELAPHQQEVQQSNRIAAPNAKSAPAPTLQNEKSIAPKRKRRMVLRKKSDL
ncbi:hypothetical protein [Tumebacillus lipolyticus]|uniref:Spore coat protein n=1 Tax=Tumebacillus lipolyticus TaxID=1280370 RepID=A0ABW4ZVP9_9BACL